MAHARCNPVELATTIASACPYCMTMLSDGVKNKELEDIVKNRDVLELAADALQG